jgi:hypothetical protein
VAPEPFLVSWGDGRTIRIRHDDHDRGPHEGNGQQVRAAVQLASDVEGLRLVLESAIGREYRVKVSDDGSVVALWRR